MEDRIYCKAAYKCGICGTEHETIRNRMNCERACIKKQDEDAKKAEAAKKAAEQKLRKEAVDEAIKRAVKLQCEYVKDYGHYEYEGELVENIFFPSKLWHHFGF